MAKGKSTTAAKSPSTARKKGKPPASNKARRSSPATKPPAETQRAISSDEIGHVAGDLWQLLHAQNGQSIAAIKKAINAPNDLVLAAIGWLAREDKLSFSTHGRTVKISLC